MCNVRTKKCECNTFWMENPFKAHLGKKESNCGKGERVGGRDETEGRGRIWSEGREGKERERGREGGRERRGSRGLTDHGRQGARVCNNDC